MLDQIKIEAIIDIAIQAGIATMEIYQRDFDVEYKADQSPLTQADLKANQIICEALSKLYPTIPILSEENKTIEYSKRKDWDYFWCIDPIDGTKEFVKKNDEFTINIALIAKDSPVAGVVYAPALGELYYAKKGEGAFKGEVNSQWSIVNRETLPYVEKDETIVNVVASKSHLSQETKDFIDTLSTSDQRLSTISKGSSLKLCMIATGEADIYPRLGSTMEWDTAAADAIVRESGKMTYQFDNDTPVVYNKENLLNPWFIVK
jgi:3'(2'), 5'-bisphosphate nucleotidase